MKRVSFIVMIALAVMTAPAIAQQTTTQGSGQGAGQGSGQGRATTSTSQVVPGMSNVRLELTITDQSASGAPVKKVVTMLIVERGQGRVRSGGEVYKQGTESAPGSQYVPVTLNADATIRQISEDRISTHITVEYMPAMTGASAHRMSMLNQTVDVVLNSGKPTLIVESADPTSDRKVTLSVTATIVR